MVQTCLAVFLRESAAVNAATLGALPTLTGVAGTRFGGALADRQGAGRAFAAASAACWPSSRRCLCGRWPRGRCRRSIPVCWCWPVRISSAVYVGASPGGLGTLPPVAGVCVLAAFAGLGHAQPSARRKGQGRRFRM
ncbi:hypothetical protein ACSNOI_05155 [Actinomadura kijaniata]|uniref:hypothetical protein n=1 Tax=Actinomadura kijaniata TaxID=46161 RepID=UPI003F1D6ED1